MASIRVHLVWDAGSHRVLLGPLPAGVARRICEFAAFETMRGDDLLEVSFCVYPVELGPLREHYVNKDYYVRLTNFGEAGPRLYFVQGSPSVCAAVSE